MLSKLIKTAITATLFANVATAHAAWPERPITWIVPFSAGGPMDMVSRPVAQKMSDELGVPIVVENKSGAGGTLGMAQISRAKPDGYTIGIASIGTQAIAPNINATVTYDPNTGFTPVGLLGKYVNVLIVNAKSDIKSVKDLSEKAADPAQNITFGSAGNGSSNHLSGELLKLLTKSPFIHVPYRGSAPALTDLLGGNITFMFDTLNTSMGHIENGNLLPLAVTSPERSKYLPNVPTMDEAGITGYADTGSELWWGVVGPAGIPEETLAKLNTALVNALNSAEIHAQFEKQYVEGWPSTPQEFADVVKKSHTSWGEIIKAANITNQ
ncbi:Bug family tripartite tricarboxylate transporter substrate binding protein [Pollutimonas harenae]|uniref:Tripartite tricarboxylate transporter substrate binding protein n=1 Tax=Pollutimonas harenae TaxID=657015 RepID=A0A853GYL3_9BURK|nr:tripartite tricarboxylate transporter substrate binding protein [Pollutimonas harenae]NYT84145.1 tripartite tricarboxylate transporter substrate binding protein [Pollutimonas harenae]TEA73439.1 tripartite tricarboxylate transporter substrate binding protein [Pollutimonas harenae]